MKKFKRVVSLLLACVMIFSMTACGGGSSSTESSGSGTASVSDLLKVALAVNPPTLDPWLSTAAAVRDANRGIYEGLFELDENLEPKEQLCESYTVDSEHKEWTFKLRQGVKFHNGDEMKAEDVVASLNCWIKNNVAAPSVITAGETFEKVDDYTVKISLEKPEYIGTGPMKFEEWKQDSYIRFTKNEEYTSPGYALTGEAGDKTVYYKEIYYYIVTDSSIRTAGIQSGG